MRFEIMPFKGVAHPRIGEILFGRSRTSIRSKLGADFETFEKDVGENQTDAYDGLGLHLYYDDDDKLECIEMFEPASPCFKRVKMIGRKSQEVIDEFAQKAEVGRKIDMGYQYDARGFSFFAPSREIEGVTVFRRGYYDDP